MSEDEDEDDTNQAGCPICEDKECQRHLLACFDESGDAGGFGVGLVGGALMDAKEIPQVLERARLAWVQSIRVTGKPKASPWVMKDKCGLRNYFDALGGIDVDKYDSDEDAVHDLAANTENELWHARENFLSEALSRCGSVSTTSSGDVPHGGFAAETTYQYWWAENPREIVEKFRAKLRSMLLAARAHP